MVWPAIIGGVATLAGSLLAKRSEEKQANIQSDFQREFAQHGIRWKVEDAKAAGLHPLAALGAQTTAYQPVYVGGTGSDYGLSKIGQDISRAISSRQTWKERYVEALRVKQEEEKLRNMVLQNDRLASDAVGTPPAFPIPEPNSLGVVGQDNAVQYVRPEVTTMSRPGVESGLKPLKQAFIDKDSTISHMFSRDASEPAESNPMYVVKDIIKSGLGMAKQLMAYQFPWGPASMAARYELVREKNRLITELGKSLPKGSDLRYNPWSGEWHVVRNRKRVRLYHVRPIVQKYFERNIDK